MAQDDRYRASAAARCLQFPIREQDIRLAGRPGPEHPKQRTAIMLIEERAGRPVLVDDEGL
jgi:hypothetical protein